MKNSNPDSNYIKLRLHMLKIKECLTFKSSHAAMKYQHVFETVLRSFKGGVT